MTLIPGIIMSCLKERTPQWVLTLIFFILLTLWLGTCGYLTVFLINTPGVELFAMIPLAGILVTILELGTA